MFCKVNAWFQIKLPRGKFKNKNVTGIEVNLPESELGSKIFRDKVRKHSPGPEYTLQGYCLASAAPSK